MDNQLKLPCDVGEVSDGYHTFNELYEHRITLFIALCKNINEVLKLEKPEKYSVWKSKRHSDGELCFGDGSWFVMGIGIEKGKQITYHLPISNWEKTTFADELDKAPEFDGHTPKDVLERIKKL